MKFLAAIFLVLAACIITGCKRDSGVYAITFSSDQGEVLATGTISLKEKLPPEGKVTAEYRLSIGHTPEKDFAIMGPGSKGKKADAAMWLYRLFRECEQGEVEIKVDVEKSGRKSLSFDFMPGMADANITASVDLSVAGTSSGGWYYCIFAGGFHGGNFQIAKK